MILMLELSHLKKQYYFQNFLFLKILNAIKRKEAKKNKTASHAKSIYPFF